MTSRAVGSAVLLGLLVAGPLTAQVDVPEQRFRFGVYGVGIVYNEVNDEGKAEGGGIGGMVALRLGRFGIEASGYAANLDPDAGDQSSYDVLQGDVRVSYRIMPAFAFEVGVGRRTTDPDLAAQDVGLVRTGVVSEMALARIASIRVRGAYLIAPQFDGGGTAPLSLELALGVTMGTANGRFRGRVEYEFQRIDREIDALDVPLQLALGRIGVEVGF